MILSRVNLEAFKTKTFQETSKYNRFSPWREKTTTKLISRAKGTDVAHALGNLMGSLGQW